MDKTIVSTRCRGEQELASRWDPCDAGDGLITTALLLAAGAGARLQPLTDNCPKCLTEVRGVPILGRLVSCLLAQGFDRLVVVVGYRDDQIRDYERQLAQAEGRLADFKRKNMGFLPGGGNYYSKMQGMQARIVKTEGLIGEAVGVRDELRRQLENVPEFHEVESTDNMLAGAFAGPGTGPASDTQVRILEIENAIDELLTRYTRRHPDVVAAQRRLDALKKQLFT